jgi:hypothetical protein
MASNTNPIAPALVEAFRFNSFEEWVDTGRDQPWTWQQTTIGQHTLEVCADALGRVCRSGADFQRARVEGTYPVVAYRVERPTAPPEAAAPGGEGLDVAWAEWHEAVFCAREDWTKDPHQHIERLIRAGDAAIAALRPSPPAPASPASDALRAHVVALLPIAERMLALLDAGETVCFDNYADADDACAYALAIDAARAALRAPAPQAPVDKTRRDSGSVAPSTEQPNPTPAPQAPDAPGFCAHLDNMCCPHCLRAAAPQDTRKED